MALSKIRDKLTTSYDKFRSGAQTGLLNLRTGASNIRHSVPGGFSAGVQRVRQMPVRELTPFTATNLPTGEQIPPWLQQFRGRTAESLSLGTYKSPTPQPQTPGEQAGAVGGQILGAAPAFRGLYGAAAKALPKVAARIPTRAGQFLLSRPGRTAVDVGVGALGVSATQPGNLKERTQVFRDMMKDPTNIALSAVFPIAAAKQRIDYKKVLDNAPQISRLLDELQVDQVLSKRGGNMKADRFIKYTTDLMKAAQEHIPGILRSREMKQLEKTNPREFRRVVGIYLGDVLEQAKNPELNIGLSTQAIKRRQPVAQAPNASSTLGDIPLKQTTRDVSYPGKKRILNEIEGKTPDGKFLGIRYWIDEDKNSLNIIGLSSESKGKGYGTELVNKVIEDAKSKGINTVVADDIRATNSSGYWKKLGFTLDTENNKAILDVAQAPISDTAQTVKQVDIPKPPMETAPGLRPHKFATPQEQKIVQDLIPDIKKDPNFGQTIPISETARQAEQMGLTKEAVLRMDTGTKLNAAQNKALEGVYVREQQKLIDMKKALDQARTSNADEATTEALRSAYLQQKVDTVKVGMVRRMQASESGRALNALRQQYKRIESAEDLLAKRLSEADPDVRALVEQQLTKVGDNPAEVEKILQKLASWSVMDMVIETATALKLYAIPTHVVNTITSLTRSAIDVPLKGMSGVIDSMGSPILKKIYGTNRARWAGEATADLRGMTMGLKTGITKAVDTMRSEKGMNQAMRARGFEPRVAIKGRPGKNVWFDNFLDFMGPKVRYSFRALSAEDALIRPIKGQGELHALAYRDAMQKGLKPNTKKFNDHIAKLLTDPPVEFIEKSNTQATVALFQEDLHKDVAKVNQLINQIPVLKLIVPFFRTPANLVRQFIEFTPASPILPGTRQAFKTRGEAVDAVSKMTLGTMAMIPLTMHAFEGKITGAAPRSKAERDRFYREGKQPYAIKLGEKWYTYGRFSPFAEWFSTAALVADVFDKESTESTSAKVGNFMMSQLSHLSDKSFMSGVSDALNAIINPQMYGERFAQNFIIGATTPTLAGNIARTIDPVVRETKGLKEGYMARTPFLSKKLPAKTNAFGEDIVRTGTAMQRLVSPVQVSEEKVSDIDRELGKYGVEVGFAGNTIGGEKLSREQQREYQKLSGQMIKQDLDAVINSSNYQQASPELKEKILSKTINDARSNARDRILVGDTQLGKTGEKNMIQYIDESGSMKTINIGKVTSMPENTNMAKAIKEKEVWSTVNKVMSADIPEDQQQSALKTLGVKKEEAYYYNIATQTVDVKMAYLEDTLPKFQNRESMLQTLASMRVKVNDKQILTDTMIRTLRDEGVIGANEAKSLINLKYDKKTGKTVSTGKGKKIKVPSLVSTSQLLTAFNRFLRARTATPKGDSARSFANVLRQRQEALRKRLA
jgi:hypothetical protein